MNPIELYKNLPKTNCGRCGQKTCMAFAISVVNGSFALEACTELQRDKFEQLSSKITKVDTIESILETLRQEVRKIDLAQVAGALGAEVVPDGVRIRCLGRDFVIDKNGDITSESEASLWMKILLLIYLKMGGGVEPSGNWVSFDSLKMGNIKAAAFTRECQGPLTELFKQDFGACVNAIKAIGATSVQGQPSTQAWIVRLLPNLPALIMYWQGDSEFPAEVKMLFDGTADRFLDVESLVFLLRELVILVKESRVAR
ncbi:Fe-S cluster domain-containing protein [Candidatus Magnetobacterium bavaricum]|uniref:Fe-S cluster domain-containing protein n=1 Tax=Candidatus Magnetobacterium bavaricum TaxID=29290 RepID=A0A0F3GLQ6_9BACT|nr:Fe-S cluster domain-containing protein [Candidatus Magnetobacterium bavaricum]